MLVKWWWNRHLLVYNNCRKIEDHLSGNRNRIFSIIWSILRRCNSTKTSPSFCDEKLNFFLNAKTVLQIIEDIAFVDNHTIFFSYMFHESFPQIFITEQLPLNSWRKWKVSTFSQVCHTKNNSNKNFVARKFECRFLQ